MKDYLEKMKKQFYLNLGRYEFSPFTQIISAIALDYAKAVKKSEETQPFIFTVPVKDKLALWISIQILINEFLNDLIFQSSNRFEKLDIKSGDKIEIFSTTAIFRKIDPISNQLLMRFKDGVEAYSSPQNIQFINPAKKNMVNNYAHYIKKRRAFLNKRTALSQILNLDLNPNLETLSSKVVLIAGRGNVTEYRRQLKTIKLYDESLANIIRLDKNFIISPDFEGIIEESNSESEKNSIFFQKAVSTILKNIETENIQICSAIEICLDLLANSLKTKQFIECYNSLQIILQEDDQLESIGLKLNNLIKYHPGIEDVLKDISAVVINDFQLFLDNSNSIKSLRDKKIPVYILSDRVIRDTMDLDIYTKAFEGADYSNVYRINFDRKKALNLTQNANISKSYIDWEAFNSYSRFLNQEILIEELHKNEFDDIFRSIESKEFLSMLGGFEILQKAYYQILRPLLYVIKNSTAHTDSLYLLKNLESFLEVFNSSSFGFNSEEKSKILISLKKLKDYIISGHQPKEYPMELSEYFYQDISISGRNMLVPIENPSNELIHHNEIKNIKEITFIGYPYREYSFRYLDDAVLKKIVPNVRLLLNECEASITFNFLKRKLESGYYVEKYPLCLKELTDYRITSHLQIQNLIEDILKYQSQLGNNHMQSSLTNANDFLNLEKELNELRYSEYKGSQDDEYYDNQYLLNSNVLHFENGSYVFLPFNWRILIIKESITGLIQSSSLKIDEISVGDVAVIVNVSRESITKYLEGSPTMLSHIKELDTWREILRDCRENSSSVADVAQTLKRINGKLKLNGSPEKYNILRWLHDETMLAPAEVNLKMILGLKYEGDELEKKLHTIMESRTKIINAKNKLDRAIQKSIEGRIGNSLEVLEDDFILNINGIQVRGKKSVVVGIEKKSDLKIDYHSTLKFIK